MNTKCYRLDCRRKIQIHIIILSKSLKPIAVYACVYILLNFYQIICNDNRQNSFAINCNFNSNSLNVVFDTQNIFIVYSS